MKNSKKIWIALSLLSFVTVFSQSQGNKIVVYVNSNIGKDAGIGTKEYPLQSLQEAAKRVNKMVGEGSVEVILNAGTYGLSETAAFNPVNWKFSEHNRLIIRAEILPDNSNWNPASMPIIVSTMPFLVEKNEKQKVTGGSNYGILVESSHVTIQGLRILGEPVHEKPAEGVLKIGRAHV